MRSRKWKNNTKKDKMKIANICIKFCVQKFTDFYQELEKRLAAVLCHSFQQCRTIGSQLRILEVFEGVNNREVIRIAIQSEDYFMTSSFLQELMSVKDMIDKYRNQVPEHVNVPLIVSKLRWQYALTNRIETPMGKLLKVSPTSLQSEAGAQIQQLYKEIMEKLVKYKEKLLKDWQRGLNPEIKERLKDFVLVSSNILLFTLAPTSRAQLYVSGAHRLDTKI